MAAMSIFFIVIIASKACFSFTAASRKRVDTGAQLTRP